MSDSCFQSSALSISNYLKRNYIWSPGLFFFVMLTNALGTRDTAYIPIAFFPDTNDENIPFNIIDALLQYYFNW